MKTMSETRLTEGPLHHLDGKLAECGWATSLLRAYDRDRIKAPKRRIKEWDYYLVNDDEFAVALTVADMGYVGLISASVMDFAQATSHTASVISPFPMGRFKLPATSAEGVTSFENNRVSFRFEVAGGQRRLNVWFAGFDGGDDLTFEAVLDEEPRDSMVISTPWAEDPLAFYYNQKIVAMQARGSFKKGLLVHGFCPESSFGLLDWGRGVWTRDNTWYWAAGLAGRSSLRPQLGLRVRRHVGGFREHGVHRRCCAQAAPRGLRHPREDGRRAREEDGRSLPAHAALAYDRRRGTARPRVHAAARPCGLDGLQADPIRPAPGIRPLRRCGDA